MLPELATEEYSALLDRVASETLVDAGVLFPPVDAFAIARALRFEVAWDDHQQGRARLTRLALGPHASQPSILLRSDPRHERRQFAVAHEIGEALSCRVFERLGVIPAEAPPYAREQVANQLAGRLLLPTDCFSQVAPSCGWDLAFLKCSFATASHELIARRMLDFPPPVIITVVDAGRVTFRRSNLPGRTPPMSPAERQCQRQATATGQPSERTTPAMTIRAWPIHEPDWRREILRSELREAESFV
jgi:hypothetical protein